MRVLVISQMYPNPRRPLDGVFIKERVRNLSSYCEVKVICPYPWFPAVGRLKRLSLPKKEIQGNVEVYYSRYFPLPRNFFNWIKGFWSFLFIYKAAASIKNFFDFDIIHAHRVYPEGFSAVLLSKIFKKQAVITIHGSDINVLIKNFFVKQIILFSLKKTDQIIAVSNALKEKITQLGIAENKVEILSNAVDLEKFRPLNRIEARKAINLPLNKSIILFIGNFVYQKNPLALIKTAYEIKKQRPGDLFFAMLGDGNLRPEVEKQIKQLSLQGTVELFGQKRHEDIHLWMSAADVLVLTSISEGLPTVLVEAMACGLPIIATRVGGVPEIIEDKERGILVEPNDISETAKSILMLIDNENLKEKFRKNGENFIREKKLTWNEEAGKTFAIYKKLLKR